MIVFRFFVARIVGAVLPGLGILVISYSVAFADTTSVADYTDEQLLAAGWTVKQIADARASTPKRPPEKSESTDSSSKGASIIVLEYDSVFKGYRSFEELPETGWREANDNVGRIGGWRSYARQVQAQQKKESGKGEDK